jgi:hypothetical protein
MAAAEDKEAHEPDLASEKIYQIRVDLKDIRPPIWRRLLVPADITLDYLHTFLQIAMGWMDSHLHSFQHNGVEICDSELAQDSEYPSHVQVLDEAEVTLDSLLQKAGDKLTYEYDFGDNWIHVVKLEKILPADPTEIYPICIAGRRACPPEDVGGVWGYKAFLEALADEAHPDHEEYMTWIDGDFDPEEFDLEEINDELQDFWEPPPPPLHPVTTIRWEMLSPDVTPLLLGGVPGMVAEPRADIQQKIEPLRKARSVRELLDLIPVDDDVVLLSVWTLAATARGPAAAPEIAEHMVRVGTTSQDGAAWIQQRLAVILFGFGASAVLALEDVFEALDPFGKAVACVVLGQLGASGSADKMWAYFFEAYEDPAPGYFIGPLWGLIDLNDPRAVEAVAQVATDHWTFPELPAMIAKVGDRRAVRPLLLWMMKEEPDPDHPLMHALTLLGHRIGRQVIIEEVEASATPQEPEQGQEVSPAELADLILRNPVEPARAAFRTMFETLTLEELIASFRDHYDEDDEYLDADDLLDDEEDLIGPWMEDEPPAAASKRFRPQSQPKPGRNDPCWCGSGKRYKDCHWRSDLQRDMPQAA